MPGFFFCIPCILLKYLWIGKLSCFGITLVKLHPLSELWSFSILWVSYLLHVWSIMKKYEVFGEVSLKVSLLCLVCYGGCRIEIASKLLHVEFCNDNLNTLEFRLSRWHSRYHLWRTLLFLGSWKPLHDHLLCRYTWKGIWRVKVLNIFLH